MTTQKPIYCPRRHGVECDTPNACAGGADCRFGPDPATQGGMTTPKPATVPLAAVRAAIDAMEAYVPYGQRENARAHALAVGIGYAYPPPKAKGRWT